nr:hypothetical protein BaRGS_017502 [Batillaria attramentaria]
MMGKCGNSDTDVSRKGRNLPLRLAAVDHMGVYRCVAYNNIKPPDEHLCEVRVFHAPTTRTVQNSVGQAQNRKLTARLDCIVNGYPRPSVRWERIVSGGRVVLTDNDFFVTSKQTTDNQNLYSGEEWYTLKIKNVRANDYTDYFCIADNIKGSSEVVITVFERWTSYTDSRQDYVMNEVACDYNAGFQSVLAGEWSDSG